MGDINLCVSEEFGAVINCAVRYALGRRTYMPGLVIEQITPVISQFDDRTLSCLVRDIEAAMKSDELGDDCDANEWIKFNYLVRNILKERSEKLIFDRKDVI